MLSNILSAGNAPLLKQTARFAERRQEVIAGNIANIDTPEYRLRDLPEQEFQRALQTAASMMKQGTSLGAGSALPGNGWLQSPSTSAASPMKSLDELFPQTLYQSRELPDQPGITFQDASNRSIEHQVLQMTKNSILQNFALQLLNGHFRQLETVISERIS